MNHPNDSARPDRVAKALADGFWARADENDATGTFPKRNFEELSAAGLLTLNVPVAQGGAGLGPEAGKPLELWKVTRAIAYGDPPTGQCFHVHANEIDILLGLATPPQVEQFLRPVVERRLILGGYGSQLTDSKPTIARRTKTGWVLDGKKFFCTNSDAAGAALVWALVEGDADPSDRIQVFYVSHGVAGMTVERDWWAQFQGMRATTSHVVAFDHVEVDESAALGQPGDYLKRDLQPRAYCQFASSFIGIADRLLAEARKAVEFRRLGGEASAVAKLGQSRVLIDAAWGLVEQAAEAYKAGDPQARFRALGARYFAEQAVRTGLENTLDNVGTYAASKASGLSRLVRDINLYIRHESRDRILHTIGLTQLDREVDASFSGDNPILKGLQREHHSTHS